MAQRRGVRRVAPLFECGAGRSQLLPTAPGAVDHDDVFGFGHETKDDSQGARHCPIRVKLFCRREAGGGCASSTMSIAISTARRDRGEVVRFVDHQGTFEYIYYPDIQ